MAPEFIFFTEDPKWRYFLVIFNSNKNKFCNEFQMENSKIHRLF